MNEEIKRVSSNHPGRLYVVATPIGHLQDITFRALTTLKQVDAIAAEDTRHSSRLLQHYQITTPVFSLHEHNEQARIPEVLSRLTLGESIALISDAGTPLIHDPGYHLIRECHLNAIEVVPIPGACALIAALSVAGLPSQPFFFEGFLPAKSTARCARLAALSRVEATLIFYEAPHRIRGLIDDLLSVLGPDRLMVVAREMTKTFESIEQGSILQWHEWVSQGDYPLKGEFVVLIEGYVPEKLPKQEISEEATRVIKVLLAELPLKQAVSLATKITGEKKNSIYQYALQIKS